MQTITDYSVIKGLEPDLPIQGPAFLEAIPPPAIHCIQLHRLKHGQNLAHLVLLYHHFGAKAIIFVNTESKFKFCLPQELLNTINLSREGTTRVNCVIVSKDVGGELIEHCRQGGVTCEISYHSCDTELPSTQFPCNWKAEIGEDCIAITKYVNYNSVFALQKE